MNEINPLIGLRPKLAHAVRLPPCITDVPGSNLKGKADYHKNFLAFLNPSTQVPA